MVSGGGALNRSASLLSADGKYILVAAASSVRLYSSVTAEIVHTLDGHTQEVTAVVLDHASDDKVFTASLDGTVKHWNYVSGQLLHSTTVGDPIKSMVIPEGGTHAYLQCDWQAQAAGKMLFLDLTQGKLASYSLRLQFPSNFAVSQSGRLVATFFKHTVFVYSTERPAMQPLKLYHTRSITCVAVDPTEERIAAGDVSGRILIWNSFKDKVPTLHKSRQPSSSTATAAAPAFPAEADTVMQAAQTKCEKDSDSDSDSDSSGSKPETRSGHQATAPQTAAPHASTNKDATATTSMPEQAAAAPSRTAVEPRESSLARFGRMQNSLEQVPLTTVHWHAHPVGSVCFSADGTLLLSGGEEAVLVIWQLDSGHKRFLPRLGGGLLSITRSPTDPACYVVSQADNTVRMVNTATMKVQVSVHGMRPPPRSVSAVQSSSVAVLAPGGGELVLPADNSMLQFWDAARDCHVDRLQVAPRNTVSLSQHDHALQGGVYGTPLEPHVSQVAFSHDGCVMATVDVRPNAGSLGSNEQSLRFWDRRKGGITVGSDQEQPFYATNTYLDDPHRGGTITSLAYHPTTHMAVTTSSGGDFKLWVRQKHRKDSAAHWRCQSVGNYKGEPLSAAAFSSDGSLLAVAAQDLVTLWEPYSNSMITSLASPQSNQGCPLCKLLFVPNTPYLVGYTTGSSASLIVWNLLTESIWWSYSLTVTAMAVDPESSSVAVAVAPQKATADGQKAIADGQSGHSQGVLQQQAGVLPITTELTAHTADMLRQGPMTVPDPDGEQTVTGASAVFLFVPSSGQPQLSWSLGQSTVASLLFALPGTKLHSVSTGLSPAGVGPLLILTEDRQYAVARSAAHLHDASFQPSTPLQSDQPSTYEAAFGKAAVSQSVRQMAANVPGRSHAQIQIQALFDAPSHVLPPLKDLAPAYFDSLIENNSIVQK